MPKDSGTQDLDQLYEASRAVKRPLMGQAFLNVSYYDNRQWVKFDGTRIWEPPLDPGRVKLTDNRIRPTVLTRVAKKTKTRPVFVGVPRTQSDDDISAARYAELALEWEWNQLSLARKLRAALVWADVAFAGFWKTTWDSTLGKEMQILCYGPDHEQAGQPIVNQYGGPLTPDDAQHMPAEVAQVAEEKTIHMGDVAVDLKTFFDIYPDPLASEEGLESAQFLIEEGVYSPDYVHDHFDKDLEPDATPTAGIAESRMPASLVGAGSPEGYKGIRLREYWHKPSSQHPRGRRVVWAKNEVLFEDDNPYPWLPYVMFGGTPVPGRFWPNCPTTDLISPQTELNKVKSQIADNGERIGNPPLAVPVTMPEGWNWHNLPGEQVPYQPTGGPDSLPQFLNMPEMPSYVQNQIGTIENSIREISGQHEVSSAQVPAGVTAASAINLLQEQDDTRLGPDIADMEETLANAGKRVLWLLGRFCDDERMMRIAGEDGAWDFYAFKGQMLKGCDDIEVQAGSGLPQSKAAKQAAIQQILNLLIQNGKAPDERSLRRITREYEVGGLEAFFADLSKDVRQVNDENRRMALGERFGINSFDNHPVHVAEHQDFRKTSRYRRLVAQNPDADAIFEAHVELHKNEMVNQAEAMAGAGQPVPPPGTNGNGGSPPIPSLDSGPPSSSG